MCSVAFVLEVAWVLFDITSKAQLLTATVTAITSLCGYECPLCHLVCRRYYVSSGHVLSIVSNVLVGVLSRATRSMEGLPVLRCELR